MTKPISLAAALLAAALLAPSVPAAAATTTSSPLVINITKKAIASIITPAAFTWTIATPAQASSTALAPDIPAPIPVVGTYQTTASGTAQIQIVAPTALAGTTTSGTVAPGAFKADCTNLSALPSGLPSTPVGVLQTATSSGNVTLAAGTNTCATLPSAAVVPGVFAVDLAMTLDATQVVATDVYNSALSPSSNFAIVISST